ncbi:hypothetical protein KUV80_10825 [Fictibacillus nanhaiensis]|uniref:hypothetical protein n=1 Tax=Fictibacillus nanhaiensis TaxID=742169 RepID=UPI001C96AA67|nr:hypothetical protein [Fictibacillus nanhaiensis]MBY6037152.1 hypothetical protein [Fictibacillus nanhaiensis]
MTIERGNIVWYQNKLHKVLHVYTSEYLEIQKVDERYVHRVILVHKSDVVVQN